LDLLTLTALLILQILCSGAFTMFFCHTYFCTGIPRQELLGYGSGVGFCVVITLGIWGYAFGRWVVRCAGPEKLEVQEIIDLQDHDDYNLGGGRQSQSPLGWCPSALRREEGEQHRQMQRLHDRMSRLGADDIHNAPAPPPVPAIPPDTRGRHHWTSSTTDSKARRPVRKPVPPPLPLPPKFKGSQTPSSRFGRRLRERAGSYGGFVRGPYGS
jgi:hypothetical protein